MKKEKTAILSLRVPSSVKTAIEKAAFADNRTPSNFVLNLLIQYLREHGYLRDGRLE